MMRSFDHINRQLKRFALVLLALAWSNHIQADTSVSTWEELKSAMANGGTINLTADCTDPSPSSDNYLYVESGYTVTLNLNGHTIDRGLGGTNATSQANGLVREPIKCGFCHLI